MHSFIFYLVGLIIGVLITLIFLHQKFVGRIVIITDPETNESLTTMEIDKNCLRYIKPGNVVKLKIEERNYPSPK